MAATLDTAYVAKYTGWPQSNITTLLDAPTTETVTSFLQLILSRAQEHERLKADRLRIDVELENAVRGGEAKARALKAVNEKSLREVEKLRTQLNEQEAANGKLSEQIKSLESSTSSTSTETEALHSQISKLEKSNRETLSLLDSKSVSYDKLAEEVTTQHKKTVDLRREISTVEEKLSTAESNSKNFNFKESNLKNEIELLKRNNEWLDGELKAKTAEYLKYRKEKSARISELQRLNEDSAQQIEGLQQTEQTLRKRVEEVGQKADEAFTRIQQVQEDAARNEESFRLELDNAKRLVELQKQSADTARRRVQELEETLEQTKDDAAEEISQGLAEVETERQDRQAAEQKLEQLEEELEKLRSAQASAEAQGPPGTPNRLSNGFAASLSGRGGSPSPFTPSGTRRGGLTFTQLYAEYNGMKTELETEKRRSEKLATTLDDLIREMEQKEPEAQESQLEHERLQAENNDLNNMLNQARQEKENERKNARKYQSQTEAFKRESDLLKQQLRDLSTQIKVLLVEVQIRENGIELSAAERQQLQYAASGAGDVEALEGMSAAAQFITERLVSFKNIFELQEKNTELTRIVREIGEEQEAAEATSLKLQQTQQERDAATERLERYKDEIKSLVTQSESYIRERDMFRRMLSHRGQIPRDADLESMFGASVNGPGTPRTPQPNRNQDAQSPTSREAADLAKLLKEYQSQFDAYRRETGTDMTSIKDQNATLSKEKSHLQGEVARISSQLTLAHERFNMLQSNLEQAQAENAQLQTRANSVMESAAKQDLKTQQAAEDLVEANGKIDTMDRELRNLKGERDLAKRIEDRLQEDNRALQEERSRLGTTLTETQRLFNERELSDADGRRKLQSQIDSLEAELRTVKQKLDDEIESSKSLVQRKEYESEQSRTRIDDLVKMVSNVKEELVAAKTVRDQLQGRVDELKIELRNAEERAQALQPRLTPRPTLSNENAPNPAEAAVAREQELSLEIADLRKELDLTKNELDNAHGQVEQYKAIAQSAEEELSAVGDTQESFRMEMDKVIAEKESKISDLEQRLQDMSSELNTTNNQLSELRTQAQTLQSQLNTQKSTFDDQLSKAADEAENWKQAAGFHQEDLKAQAEIAQQAQQSYENELVKHGEATKTLHTVRIELNQLKLEVSQHKADAEAARTTMSQSEDSWLATKEKYEKELTEIKSRRDDVAAQNKVLHEQLENFSKQIATLQDRRIDAEKQSTVTTSSDSGMQNLQEVIKFLRGEKEIVDMQLEMSTQETRRLKQQLEHSNSQLEETRFKLEQERQKQTDNSRTAINHSKLMDTINELNVFRESNVTLRNQLQHLEAQLTQKSKQVDDLITELQPLQSTVRELESEKETTQGELKLLEEDRNRWQKRTQDILQKYDRIDPAELEALKEQITHLQTERDEAASQKQSLQEQVDRIPEDIQKAQAEARATQKATLVEQFKSRSRELSGKISEANKDAKNSKDQLEAATAELETTKAERDTARTELEAATKARDEAVAQLEVSKGQQNNMEDGQVDEDGAAANTTDQSELEAKVRDAESRVKAEADKAQALQSELDQRQARVAELEARVTDLEQRLSTADSNLATLQEQAAPASESVVNEHLERVKQELAAAQQDIEAMRNASANSGIAPAAITTAMDGNSDVAGQVAAEVAQIKAELEADHNAKVKQQEDRFNTRAESMKKQLIEKLAQGRTKAREESEASVKQEHESVLQKIKQEHEASIRKLNQQHETAINELKQQHQKEMDSVNSEVESVRKEMESLKSSAAPAQSSNGVPPPASTVAPSTEPAFNEDSTIKVKAETTLDAENWTQQQAQAFVNTNPGIKAVVIKNIKSRMEAESTKLKEESEVMVNEKLEEAHREAEANLAQKLEEVRKQAEEAREKAEADQAQKLEEARKQAEKVKETAVSMEVKKSALKNNLLEGRMRTANAKLDFVQRVATDTPEREVGGVWAEAKLVKPAPAPLVTQSPAPGSMQPPNQTPQTPTQRRTSSAQTNASAPAAAPSAAPTPSATPAAPTGPAQSATSTPQGPASSTPPSQPAPRPSVGTGAAAIRGALSQGGPQRGGIPSIRGAARGGRGGSADGHVPAGLDAPLSSGSAPPRSGLPVSGLPRGAGRGRGGRGGGNFGLHQQGEGGSPSGRGGGNMNPRAGGFVPGGPGGNKRPAGDNAGGDGKRVRGGGGPGGQ